MKLAVITSGWEGESILLDRRPYSTQVRRIMLRRALSVGCAGALVTATAVASSESARISVPATVPAIVSVAKERTERTATERLFYLSGRIAWVTGAPSHRQFFDPSALSQIAVSRPLVEPRRPRLRALNHSLAFQEHPAGLVSRWRPG